MNAPNLNPDTIQKILNIFAKVVDGIEKFSQKISDFADNVNLSGDNSRNEDNLPKVVVEKTEFISLNDIKNIVQAHRVALSDGVAAAIKQGKNKKGQDVVQIFLTYVKGRTILDYSSNTLIVISAEAVSNEIKSLFGKEEVIILK